MDGETIATLRAGTELEVLSNERWLRVRSPSGKHGFVSEEYVEPLAETHTQEGAEGRIETYEAEAFRSDGPIRVHSGFRTSMDTIRDIANELNVQVYVISSLRRPNHPVENAIVAPARTSNHHVGYAIDVNLIFDGDWYDSKRLADWSELHDAHNVRDFFNRIRSAGLRWGGDFSTPDPVHIDYALNLKEPEHYARLVKSLWGRLV